MYIRHHPENEFGGRRIKAAAKVVAVVKVIAVAGFPVLDIFFNIIGGRCFVFDCGRIPKDVSPIPIVSFPLAVTQTS
jgi:hypothetical protein